MASYFEQPCEMFCSWLYSLQFQKAEIVNTLDSYSCWALTISLCLCILKASFLGKKRLLTHIGFGWWLPLFLKQVTKQMKCQALALGALWQCGHPSCVGVFTSSFSAGFQSPLKPVESAQGWAYFLQRLTPRLHYYLSSLFNKHGKL